MRAFLLIRADPWYRRESFERGLKALGFEIHGPPRDSPRPGDVLVIWNRYGRYHALALQFEQAGCHVIVAENGALGRDWLGDHWYTLTLNAPGCAGRFDYGGPERWDSLGVNICEWRKNATQVIILGQRGIGPPGVAMPMNWDRQQLEKFKGGHPTARIREHPGEKRAKPLEDDLAAAGLVVAWSSAAALKALLWGIPVVHGLRAWIGREAALHVDRASPEALAERRDRLPTFRALGWTMWRTREIETGEPFRRLLALPSGKLQDIPGLC